MPYLATARELVTTLLAESKSSDLQSIQQSTQSTATTHERQAALNNAKSYEPLVSSHFVCNHYPGP